MSSPTYVRQPRPVIAWSVATGSKYHADPRCAAAARSRRSLTPSIEDALSDFLDRHACRACKGRGWAEACSAEIENAAGFRAEQNRAAGYSMTYAQEVAQDVRDLLNRQWAAFPAPGEQAPEPAPTTGPAARAAEAIAIEPDPRDRDAIARARRRVAEEARRNIEALSTRPLRSHSEIGTALQISDVIQALLERLATLETMSGNALAAQVAENMPGAVLDRETGRITPADHIRQAEAAQAADLLERIDAEGVTREIRQHGLYDRFHQEARQAGYSPAGADTFALQGLQGLAHPIARVVIEPRACERCGEPLAEDRYRPGWWFHATGEGAAACKRQALEDHLDRPRSNAELAQHLRDVHKATGGWVSEPVPAASVALADELARMHRLAHTGELRTS